MTDFEEQPTAVERKYERDIDLLLAEEFTVSPAFAGWFLGRTTKFKGVDASVCKVYVSKSDCSGETDLEVVFDTAGGRCRFALLIEDKIDAPVQPEQEARYRLRAHGEALLGDYSDYEVVLCSPEPYRARHPELRFDSFVSYEEIAGFLKSLYPRNHRSIYRANFIATAAQRNRIYQIGRAGKDEPTNIFWKAAYRIAITEFPDLEMKPLNLAKDSMWITIRPLDMPTQPQHIYISLKCDRGFIDLTFNSSLVRLLFPLVKPILEPDMTVHQTGRSAAIRIKVDGFKVSPPDESALSKVRAAFAASVRLLQFYRGNRETLNKAAFKSLPDPARKH